ncbi:RNA polymerase factor sigma-54 [bacterium]|nr:RNA polymerase factor sigma-54 [bacterium]
MGLELKPILRPELRHILTPMVQHALKVLQLPTLELANMVNQELSENPFLEEGVQDDAHELKPATEVQERSAAEGEMTREVDLNEDGNKQAEVEADRWSEYFWPNEDYAIPKYDRETYADYREPQIAKQSTLEEHLLWQFRQECSNDAEYRISELIIGNLDERGFFTMPLEEIAEEAGADTDTVADVLAIIQNLEPIGVGARDVKESLLIQLRYLPERNALAEKIVERHFEALERHQIDQIVRAEKVHRSQVVQAAKVISGLDPYPGRHQFSGQVEYVTPDVVIEKHDDQYIIIINDDSLPELKLNKTYRKLLQRGSDVSAETRQFLEEKLEKAKWFIRNIDQRRKTLYRVVETILEAQFDFFEKGIEHLKPLTLREIAEQVNMHESTISRVTSQKYIQTPRGFFELKYFFSSQIKTDDGTGVSSTSVKAALNELIAVEDSRRPFSDQRLTEMLKKKGFQIARRTVAKYREVMRILPASQRRRLE